MPVRGQAGGYSQCRKALPRVDHETNTEAKEAVRIYWLCSKACICHPLAASETMDQWTDWTIRWYHSSILSPRCLPLGGAVLHKFKGYPFISLVTYSYIVRSPSFHNPNYQDDRISDIFIIFSKGGGLTTQPHLQCPNTNGTGYSEVSSMEATV